MTCCKEDCDCYEEGLEEGYNEGFAEGQVKALEEYVCPDCENETKESMEHIKDMLLDLRLGFDTMNLGLVQRSLKSLFDEFNIRV